MAKPPKKKFTEDQAQVILELGKQGASQKAMYAAIGISKDTAAKWKKEDEVFAETMSLATTYGQAYWENLMAANVENKSFNSRIVEIALRGQLAHEFLAARFPQVDADQRFVAKDAGRPQRFVFVLTAHAAHRIAVGGFHLDDLCTEVGKEASAERPGNRRAELEHAISGKRAAACR